MNFSERGVMLKQFGIKSSSKKIATKGGILAFRLFIILLVASVIIGSFAAAGAITGLISTSPSLVNLNLQPTAYKTNVFYSDGTLSETLYGSEANRSYAYIDEIPEIVQLCFIAKEDTRFYEHKGIDVQGILRAIVSDIHTKSLDYGGSTITQQLLKNQIFEGGDEDDMIAKISRKVQEQYLAIQAENMYTKDEILEFYLNVVNFGSSYYGIQEAAKGYFGKNVWELTLSEACVLAPICYSPTRRNPVKYPEKNAQYRKETLDAMLAQGYCTQEEYDEAMADDVYTRIAEYREQSSEGKRNPYTYFTDELIEQVRSDLQTRLGYTEAEATSLIYSGGLSIYTTQDKDVQAILDDIYTDDSWFPDFGKGSYYELNYALSVYKADGTVKHYHLSDVLKYFSNYQDTMHLYYHKDGSWVGMTELCTSANELKARCEEFKNSVVEDGDTPVEKREITAQPQSSMVIMEQSTGKVVAIYGGRGTKTTSLSLNRATNTVRQVGSTFKVLASFLPALDSGQLTLASVEDDSQFVYPGTTKEVTNWYKTGYRGLQSMRTACYDSMNVCAVEFLQEIGATLSFNYLKKLGFSTLVHDKKVNGVVHSDINLALALGGLTDGVTNLELTAAYATIANGGGYQQPIFYTEVYDRDGNLLLSNTSQSTQVIKASTAYLLTNAMEDVIKVGTGSRLGFVNYSMPVAGKTGTSTKANDLWFVGFTPYYTAGIWTGYDNNFSQTNTSYQQYIWRNVMERIHAYKQLDYVEFEVPDSIVTASICTKCGNLAVEGLCDEYIGGNCIKTEIFAKGTVPTEKCTCHIRVNVCTESGHLASPECPTSSLKSIVYLIKTERNYIDVVAMQKAWDAGKPYTAPVDEDGNAIYNPITTWDTPYILPTGEQAEACPIHSPYADTENGGGSFDIPTGDEIEKDDNKDDMVAID